MYNKNLRIKMSESRAPPRETISLLVLSIIGGLALTRAITIFQEVVSSGGYSILSEPTAYFLIFLSVWYRFIPGNIAHIRKLERHPTCSVGVWLLDISFMMFESMILTFMSEPSARGLPIFFSALAILLSLDVIWVFLMLPGVKKGTRPSPQTLWLILNIPSCILGIIPIISSKVGYDAFFGPKSAYSLIFLPIFFLAMAIIDIYRSGPEWFGRHVSKVSKEEIDKFMQMAIDEAKKGLGEGGIPIGAVLVKDDTLLGTGHNTRVQDGNPIAHAEIECLKNAGRVATYKGTTLYSTLMPCSMCAGAIVEFGINRVVVGESRNYIGARTFLESCGVEVIDLDNEECRKMMESFIKRNPNVWKEDIGTL
jgi:cytosine deaminase